MKKMKKKKLKTLPKGKPYPKEVTDYILEHYHMTTSKDLAAMIARDLGYSIEPKRINSYRKNHQLKTGLTGRYEKGHVPYTKGKKWAEFMSKEAQERSRSTCFKKGDIPWNSRQIGDTKVTREGYVWVKIKDDRHKSMYGNWRPLHHLLWEQHHGPIPEGKMVVFLNNNPKDIRIENLELLTQDENGRSRQYRRLGDTDVGRIGVDVARLLSKVSHMEEGTEYEEPTC